MPNVTSPWADRYGEIIDTHRYTIEAMAVDSIGGRLYTTAVPLSQPPTDTYNSQNIVQKNDLMDPYMRVWDMKTPALRSLANVTAFFAEDVSATEDTSGRTHTKRRPTLLAYGRHSSQDESIPVLFSSCGNVTRAWDPSPSHTTNPHLAQQLSVIMGDRPTALSYKVRFT